MIFRVNDAQIEDIELELLLQAVFLKYGYDFRSYARSSMHGRLLHLMARLQCPSFTALQDILLHQDDVWTEILPFLVVPHTELFRDPSQFVQIRAQVLPSIRHRDRLSFWIAGCSTGEEVVSLAVLLQEDGLLERSRIVATDINPICLEKAGKGIFSRFKALEGVKNHAEAGGAVNLSSYFETSGKDAVRFNRDLLNHVEFLNHDLATGSVIGQFDMIFCRNVLCYFDAELQSRALHLFRDSMEKGGVLAIGAMEPFPESNASGDFTFLSSDDRLFRCGPKSQGFGTDILP